MLSARNSGSLSLASPRYFPQTARNHDDYDIQNRRNTEDQQDRIKRLLDDVRRGNPLSPQALLLPQSEFNRMRNSAVILTKEEIIQQKKILDEQNEKQQAAAKGRKLRMMEIEEERKKAIPPNELEVEKRMIREGIQARAEFLLNEEKDDVKHMNQMMLYAKVVTVRDSQLKEKKDIKNHKKMEERRKDLLMEVQRLKTIKYYEEQEVLKKEELRKSALETVKQIKEREVERARRQEERNKEGQEIIKRNIEVQQEESVKSLLKKNQQKLLLDEILVENSKAMLVKQDRIRQEKEEEERIAKYLIERAQKEAEYQAEIKHIKDEKEKEILKLRKLQEKHSDRQAEIDALRARRASEGADRQARAKERMEAERKDRINKDLTEARHIQSLQKQLKLQEQAQNERNEFQRIVHTQKLERELELKMELEKKERVFYHAEQLKKQMAINEEKKKQDKREFLEEGKKIKVKMTNEKQLLENIKVNKLQQLMDLDIPNKYTAELAKKRIII